MKKWYIVICVCLMALMGCGKEKVAQTPSSETTTLKLKIQDNVNNKLLLEKEITVNQPCKTLREFLEAATELQVKTEKGSYGTTILGILGVETKDFNKGPWWLYESSTNASCVAKGMCDGVDQLQIQDHDEFIFTFTNSF